MTNFERADAIVAGIEAGLTLDPKDKGNWTGGEVGKGALKGTNMGISAARYPEEDIRNMTRERAQFLRKRDYWTSHDLDTLEYGKALLVYDTAINGGNHQRWFSMFGGYPLKDFIVNYQAEHNLYLASLPEWLHEGRGWSRRLVTLALEAAKT